MALNSNSPTVRVYDFDRAAAMGDWTTAATGTGAVSYTAGGIYGLQLLVTANTDTAFVHQGDKLPFDIDDLLDITFRYSISGNEAGTDFYLGVGSAFNADPQAIAAMCFFKIAGATNTLTIESDDGTIDNNGVSTGLTVSAGELHVAVMDFASGIQSISPPSTSLGGKASIQFTHTTTSQIAQHINPSLSQHISMQNYAAGLQIIMGGVQAGSSTNPKLYVKDVTVRSRIRY